MKKFIYSLFLCAFKLVAISFLTAQESDLTMKISNAYVLTAEPNTCITVQGSLENRGTFKMKSTSEGDASLIVSDDVNVLGSGSFQIERNINVLRWHSMSAPIVNAKSGMFSGMYLRKYSESEDAWAPYISSPNVIFSPAEGFHLWTYNEGVKPVYKGIINHGTIGPIQLLHENKGFTLIGNPYPSAIDWAASEGWTKNNVAPTIYLWNGSNWVIYNSYTGVGTGGFGGRYIALGQGFFVQSLPGGGSITLDKPIRLHNPTPFKNEVNLQQAVHILVDGDEYTDEAIVMVNSMSDEVYDYFLDAIKLYGGSEAPQIYTKKQNNNLAIHNIRESGSLHGQYVFFETSLEKDYKIHFQNTTNEELQMLDLKTGALIQSGEQYTFKGHSDDSPARFMFLINTLGENHTDTHTSHLVWEYDNYIYVHTITDEYVEQMEVYNSMGSLVLAGKEFPMHIGHLSKGVYVVRLNTNKGVSFSKIIKK